jgi:hypothetical protein
MMSARTFSYDFFPKNQKKMSQLVFLNIFYALWLFSYFLLYKTFLHEENFERNLYFLHYIFTEKKFTGFFLILIKLGKHKSKKIQKTHYLS